MSGTARPTLRRLALLTVVGASGLAASGCGLLPFGAAGGAAVGRGPMMGQAGAAPAVGSGAPAGGGPMMGAASTCTAPTVLPGARVDVALVDMPMMGGAGVDPAPLGVPMRLRTDVTTVAAGEVTFVARNLGARTHELVVLPLPGDGRVGGLVAASDGRVSEDGSLGEASASCAAGSGDGIAAGSTGWVTLTLAPGRYELLCNEPNHYADGMRAELDVT